MDFKKFTRGISMFLILTCFFSLSISKVDAAAREPFSDSKDDKDALDLVKFTLMNLTPEYTCAYLIAYDFRDKPTGAKAAALWDVFFAPHSIAELNLPSTFDRNQLKAKIDRLKMLSSKLPKGKTESEIASVIDWWISQPAPFSISTMFDEGAIAAYTSSSDEANKFKTDADLRKKVLSGNVTTQARSWLKKNWEPARKALEKGGFDMKSLQLPVK
ncbi:MAG: hypothetical protein HQM08_17980 [Candidatus Riflebacteria bacterium]|nr:hypothetical protein [Candidatus Riflebacteria bacterium]